ncbi:MAG: TNT domain-containing protein [Actinophytocola sp.]|uniref:TNT domain-containing protein n=1 Tax=Actinophytocola sp. TaxID=1872138 RepID=UPI003D6C00DA
MQRIVDSSYHRDGYDASGNPMDRAQWDAGYWPTGGYDAHGGRDLVWPDPSQHPEGFSRPEDRVPAVLNPGEQIDRFGPGFGRFTSPPGTPFPERGLPPDNLFDERDPSRPGVTPGAPAPSYHRYEVVQPIPVWAGPIAPAMGQPGGGTQFYMPNAVVDLVNAGYLREVPL